MYQFERRMYLLAVLVRDDGTLCRPGVRAKDDAILEETADDGGTGASGFGERDAALGQEVVPECIQVSVHLEVWTADTCLISLVKSNPAPEHTDAAAMMSVISTREMEGKEVNERRRGG